MFKLFNKTHVLALLALLPLSMPLMADDYCCCYCPPQCNRVYIGGFGGGIYSNSVDMIQLGTAFFTEAEDGPLAVDARGRSGRNSSGFGGVQIGYRWGQSPFQFGCCSGWSISSAAEIEAFFYKHTKSGLVVNPTDRLDAHDFVDSFPMHVGVYMVNGVFTLNSSCLCSFSPYVGGGVGAACINIHGARSTQIDPPEVGINHFNSKRHDSAWAFAAQAKVGLKYNIWDRFHIFGEYRFLFVDTSTFILGSTVYEGHAPTSPWNIEIRHICHNAFAFGIQFDL